MVNNLAHIIQEFSLYTLPPFLGFLITLCLALFAFIKGKRRQTNILFACLCTVVVFLNIDVILMTLIKNEETALAISRYDHIILVYNVPLYLHFVYSFLSMKKRKWLIPGAYIFSFLFMFFTQSQYYLVGVHKYQFGFFAQGGILFYIFISINSLVLFYCLYLFGEPQKLSLAN